LPWDAVAVDASGGVGVNRQGKETFDNSISLWLILTIILPVWLMRPLNHMVAAAAGHPCVHENQEVCHWLGMLRVQQDTNDAKGTGCRGIC